MRGIKDVIKENKKSILIFLGIMFGFVIIFIFVKIINNGKISDSRPYVYTKDIYTSEEGYESRLPFINIKGNDVALINKSLMEKHYMIVGGLDRSMIYNFYKNRNILSLLVKIYSSFDGFPEVLIYNINVRNGNIIGKNELFDKFDVDNEEVHSIILDQLKEYYNYEIENEYVNSSCDFDCYLSNITNNNYSMLADDCYYYVKDNALVAYKELNIGSQLYYDIDFEYNLFNFEIKRK